MSEAVSSYLAQYRKIESKNIHELVRNTKGLKIVNIKSPVKVSDPAVFPDNTEEK